MATRKVDRTPEQNLAGTRANAETAVTVERRVVACNAQFITVDAGKMSKGLKTTFEGVAMVFDSIGLPVQLGLTMDLEDEEKEPASVEPTVATAPAEPIASTVATEKVAVKKKARAESEPEPTPAVETQEEATPIEEASVPVEEKAPAAEPEQTEAPVEKAAEATSSITIDDITKIIVQKIKQNRKNNEKIGAILKTYEVERVGDLHPSKYEAFLTDLSAI